jgi:hypothetical protein
VRAAIVWRWAANVALAVLVVPTLDSGIPIMDGLALVGLGCVIGIDVMRGSKEGWE